MSYENFVSPTLWVLGLGSAAALAALAKFKHSGWRRPLVALALTLGVVPAIGVVPAGHRGVVYSFGGGVAADERGEGVTFLVPWVQHLVPMSVRTQKLWTDEAYSQSADLQEITVVVAVNYSVDPDRAAELYRDVGTDYEQAVILPALFQRVKEEVGQVLAEDFAQNRAAIAAAVANGMNEQLERYGITIEFVNVEDAIFDPQFIAAVKAKVVAEQAAAEQRRLIEAERAKKEQAILQAEGRARSIEVEARAQAKANRAIAQSLTPELLKWRLLIQWDGMLPTTLVGGGDGVSFLIDGRAVAEK